MRQVCFTYGMADDRKLTPGAQKLHTWLRKNGRGPSWLAREFGVSRQSVSSWLWNRHNPDPVSAELLQGLCGINWTEWLSPEDAERLKSGYERIRTYKTTLQQLEEQLDFILPSGADAEQYSDLRAAVLHGAALGDDPEEC
jgi:transcriptional regulator with XRE-family HTH domain